MAGKQIARNLSSALGQSVVQTLVLLALYRFLLETIGVDQFAVWSVVLATASVSQLANFGLAASVTKFVAQYRARSNVKAACLAVETAAISIAVAFGVAVALAYPLLYWFLPHVVPHAVLTEARNLVPYALASLWITALSGVFQSGLDGGFRTDIRAGIVTSGSVIYLLGAVLLVKSMGLIGLAWAQLSQGIFILVLSWSFLRRSLTGFGYLPYRWRLSFFKQMVSYGANLQVNSIMLILFEPITKALLSRYGGLSFIGYFEMAERLIVRLRDVFISTNQVLIPVFADLKEVDESKAVRFYATNLRSLIFTATPAFAGIFALGPAISELWIGHLEPIFVALVLLLCTAWYLNILGAPAYFAYLGAGRLRWNTASHVLMSLSNLMLGVTLGRAFGGAGVAAAFGVALVLGSAIAPVMYHREKNIRLRDLLLHGDSRYLCWCGLGALAALASYFSLATHSTISRWVRLGVPFIIIGATLLAAAGRHPLTAQIVQRLWAKARSTTASS